MKRNGIRARGKRRFALRPPTAAFKNHGEAKDATLDWLLWYNGSRLHSTLRYLSPSQFEQQALAPPLACAV